LNYTINVQSASNYDVELRVTSMFADSAFHVEVDGVDVTGRIGEPAQHRQWSAFQWVGKKGSARRRKARAQDRQRQRYFDLNSVRVLQSTTRFEQNAATYTAHEHVRPERALSAAQHPRLQSDRATATFAFSGAR